MPRSSINLSTQISTLFLAVLVAGCSDSASTCGSQGSPGDGLTVTVDTTELRYEQLLASANNDCPAPDAPEKVVSLTVSGHQVGGLSPLTLCIARPDLLTDAVPLGTAVEIVDVSAELKDCSFSFSRTTPPTGTVSSEGYCDDGTHPDGFTLVVSGELALERTCLGGTDVVTAAIAGRVAVAAQ
jgi:hypothetical protein